jgi:hypothetical protein
MPKFAAGFFAGVCTPSNATANSCDPPLPRNAKTGALLPGLRPEVDHAPRYRERRFSLG